MAFVRCFGLVLVALLLCDALFHAAGLPEADVFFSWHKLAELSAAIGIFWMLDGAVSQVQAWRRTRSGAGDAGAP